ncbi:MAG: hypothetical protein LBU98_04120 [Alistipes sp.]|jgi:hypothetical protein|nr:hypothetical protein [Alistipes sp.]
MKRSFPLIVLLSAALSADGECAFAPDPSDKTPGQVPHCLLTGIETGTME